MLERLGEGVRESGVSHYRNGGALCLRYRNLKS